MRAETTLVDEARGMAARAVDAGPGELSWMIERLTARLVNVERAIDENIAWWERIRSHDQDKDLVTHCFEVIQEEADAALVVLRAAKAAEKQP